MISYGESDYLAALQATLPRGRAWPHDPDATMTQLLAGFALSQGRVGAREAELLTDSFPATTVELLPEWEESLGLPDPCLGQNPLTSVRQAQVVARLTLPGGQTIAFFEALALQLGGSITVTEYAPFRWGIDHWGAPFYSAAWADIWLVTLSDTAEFRFEYGLSHWGEPYWQVIGGAISCEIVRLAPAHTRVNFAAGSGTYSGEFLADLSLTDSLSGAA